MPTPQEEVPDYVKELLSNLKDQQSSVVRKAAAQALGRLDDPHAVNALIEALGDSDPDVQKVVEDSLFNMENYTATPLIEMMIKSGEEVRRRAYRLLCHIKDLRMDQLAPLVQSEDTEIKKLGISLIGVRKDKRGVRLLKEIVNHRDPAIREEILKAVEFIHDSDVMPLVIQLLGDTNDVVRMEAVEVANKKASSKFIEPLIPLLKDTEASIRIKVVDTLKMFREPEVVQAMANALEDTNPTVRMKAAQALGYLGNDEAIPALNKAALDSNPQVKEKAEESIRLLQVKKSEVELIEDLKSQEAPVRELAAYKLSKMGGKDAVEPLAAVLHDTNPMVRLYAVEGLIHRKDEKNRNLVFQMIKDPSAEVRSKAGAYCASFGSAGIDILIEMVAGERRELAYEAITLLGKIKDPKAIPAIETKLKSPDIAMRQESILALGRMGKAAIEALKPLSTDPDSNIRHLVIEAFQMIGGTEVVRPILVATDSSNHELQAQATTTLAAMGEKVVDELIGNLNDKSSYIRRVVATSLGRIGSPKAIGPLSEKLKDENQEVQKKVVEALSRFSDPKVTAIMIEVLNDPEPFIRLQAGKYLAKKMDPRAVDPLVGLLRSKDKYIVDAAVLALSGMRQLPIPALTKCLEDKDLSVREIAAKLMGRLGGKADLKSLDGSFKNTDEDTRARAIRSLADFGGPEAIETLKAALKDPSEKVRAAASEVMAVIAGTEEMHGHVCPKCNRRLRMPKTRKSTFNPTVYWCCMIGGFVLLPVLLLGLPLIFYAMNMKMKAKMIVTCVYCQEKVPIPWYDE